MPATARYANGELDELFAENVSLHIEALDDGVWWIGIDHPDGVTDHLTLSTKRGAKITARLQEDV